MKPVQLHHLQGSGPHHGVTLLPPVSSWLDSRLSEPDDDMLDSDMDEEWTEAQELQELLDFSTCEDVSLLQKEHDKVKKLTNAVFSLTANEMTRV